MKRSVHLFRHVRNLILVVSKDWIKESDRPTKGDIWWDTDDYYVILYVGVFEGRGPIRKDIDTEGLGKKILKSALFNTYLKLIYSASYFTGGDLRVRVDAKKKVLKLLLKIKTENWK